MSNKDKISFLAHIVLIRFYMLKIRLKRVGAKKQPSYRVVVADSRSPRDGAFIELVGTYDPKTDPPTINLNHTKIDEWIAKGAQPSDAMKSILNQTTKE